MEYVDVVPIREALFGAISRGEKLSDICRRVGWVNTIPVAETSRLKRAVGAMEQNHHGVNKKNKYISRKNAELIAEALEIDPYDVGI